MSPSPLWVRRSFIVIALACCTVAAGACSSSSPKAVPADPTLAHGQEVFDHNCVSCHGTDGRGGSAPRLVGIAMTYPDIERQIRIVENGVKGTAMPAWKGRLSPEDIRAVALYTRSLQ